MLVARNEILYTKENLTNRLSHVILFLSICAFSIPTNCDCLIASFKTKAIILPLHFPRIFSHRLLLSLNKILALLCG